MDNYALEDFNAVVHAGAFRFRSIAHAATKTSVHIRGHDETEAGWRAGAVTGRQMGRVRL